MPKVSSTLLLCVLAGCNGSDTSVDPVAEACGGARPEGLDSCEHGMFHADCGGEPPRLLACSGLTGRCSWFAGQCLPANYLASDCPTTMPCCYTTPEGSWPFASGFPDDRPMAARQLVEDVAAIGHAPVTSDSPSDLAVSIDASIVAAGPSIACAGDGVGVFQLCADSFLQLPLVYVRGSSLVVPLRSREEAADVVYLEIVESGPSPIGRVFVRHETDSFPGASVIGCEDALTPGLTASGQLVVNHVDPTNPGTLHGHAMLVVPEGGTIAIEF